MIQPGDGFKYCTYVLLYIDDCFCIYHNVKMALQHVDKYFAMKPGSNGDPDIYL